MKPDSRLQIGLAALLLLLACWVVVYRIDAVPMNVWDESRQANNAREMLQSGNWLFTTYNGQPDFWNTKPHLLVVLQAFSMKLFGPGLLALRLPSAIAGCLTLLVWFVFLFKRHGFETAGFFVLILVSCGGFNTYHVTRTGDYDALLILFVSLVTIRLFQISEGSHSSFHWIQAGIFLALAALTKSVAVLLWAPAWLFILFKKDLFKQKNILNWLWLLGIPALCISCYYLYREILTPGYLKAVWENEWVGRYARPNEGHITPPWYYLTELKNRSFAWFILLLPVPFIWRGTDKIKKEKWLIFGMSLLFLAVISVSATRIQWYAAPVLPLLCWLLALPFSFYTLRTRFLLLYTVCIGFAAVYGYFFNLGANTRTHGVRSEWLLMQIDRGENKPPAAKWLCSRYAPVEDYYKKVFMQKGIALKFIELKDCSAGDYVIVGHENMLSALNNSYGIILISAPSDSTPYWVVRIIDKKRIINY